jgi:cell division septum initiation protein DivIVA
VEIARQKADDLVQKDMIVQEAQRRAEGILSQARADADATRREADNYVKDTLAHLQSEMERLLNQVRNGIRTIEEDQMRRSSIPPQTLEK